MPDVNCPLVPTAGFAYIRFHDTGARHRNNYTDGMLESWAHRLRKVAVDVDDVYVYFNNDALGHVVENAMTLRGKLGEDVRAPALALTTVPT